MDHRCSCTLLAVSLAASLTGCGQSTGPQPAPAGTADRIAAATKGPALGTTPKQAVGSFLEAVRLGNDDDAGRMLTDLARTKTQQINMVVAPPGSDTATFQVGQTKMVDNNVAHVGCTWTDLDNEGKPRTDQIVWTVRRGGRGWRIAGMAAEIYPDKPPIQLNFEDPEAMLRQRQLVEQEALDRAGQQQQQASKSGDPFQPGTR